MDKLKAKLIESIYKSVQSGASGITGVEVSLVAPLVINIRVEMSQGPRFFTLKLTEHTWTDEELAGVIAHEVGHLAFGHLGRRGNRDFRPWDMAGDYEPIQ